MAVTDFNEETKKEIHDDPKEKQRKAKGIAKKNDCEARSSKRGKGQTDKQPLSSRRIEEESKNKRDNKGRVLQKSLS